MTYELQVCVCVCKFRLCALITGNHEKAFRTFSRSISTLMVGSILLRASERLVQSFSRFPVILIFLCVCLFLVLPLSWLKTHPLHFLPPLHLFANWSDALEIRPSLNKKHTFHLCIGKFSPEHESTYRSDRSPNRQSVGESKGGGYSIIDMLQSFLEDICDSVQEAGNIHRETLIGFKEWVPDWARDTELVQNPTQVPVLQCREHQKWKSLTLWSVSHTIWRVQKHPKCAFRLKQTVWLAAEGKNLHCKLKQWLRGRIIMRFFFSPPRGVPLHKNRSV